MRTDNITSTDNLAVNTPTLMKMLNCGTNSRQNRHRSRSENHYREENLVESEDYSTVS